MSFCFHDVDHFGCDGRASGRGRSQEGAVEVGEVVSESLDVLDAVLIDADLAGLRVGEDDVSQ